MTNLEIRLDNFDRKYLERRVESLMNSLRAPDISWEGTPFKIKKGCRIPEKGRRPDGYAQIKLRQPGLQISPRAYEVILFVNGFTKLPNCDISHLCGRGSLGCCEPTHLIMELHSQNLSRKKILHCSEKVECPNCQYHFNIFTCDGHGTNNKCI